MHSFSTLKFIVSWITSTVALVILGAGFHVLFQLDPTLDLAGAFSASLTVPYSILLLTTLNLVIHSLFYFGGFTCAPIKKGIGLSMGIGLFYLMALVLGSSMITVHAPLSDIALNLFAILLEMALLGMMISVLSISEFHRWGIFRWV